MFGYQNQCNTDDEHAQPGGDPNSAGNGAHPLFLSDHDQHQLDIRANPRAVQIAADYWTATQPSELRNLGFSRRQSNLLPALVAPIHTVNGDVGGYEITPLNPRQDASGKIRKREQIFGRNRRLYISPLTRQYQGDPTYPAILTESIFKANAAALWPDAKVLALGTMGVSTRGRNARGGLTFIGDDFDLVALKGVCNRAMWLVPDSNATTNPQVAEETRRTKVQLERRGA